MFIIVYVYYYYYYYIIRCLFSRPPPLDTTGDPSPPRFPSRQAWQTVSSQKGTGPPTARRMARMATPPTARPIERMDTTGAGRLRILGHQVGARCVCERVQKHVHAKLYQCH